MEGLPKSVLIAEAMQILRAKADQEEINVARARQIESEVSRLVLTEPDVELASIYGHLEKGLLLAMPGGGERSDLSTAIRREKDAALELVQNLSAEKKNEIGWK